MSEDEDTTPEAEAAKDTEPEAEFKQKGRGGKPSAPRSTFRKVKTREYESGTTRTVGGGLNVTDS